MLKLFFSIAFLIFILNIKCEAQLVKIKKLYSQTNQLKEEFTAHIVNGDTLREGHYTYYLPDGTLNQSGKYKNNLPDSIWRIYYPSGEKKKDMTMVKGKNNGKVITYYETGELKEIALFINGLLDSIVTGYKKEDGSVQYRYQYIKGKANGIYEQYYEKNKILLRGIKRNDLLEDTLITYDKDGSVNTISIYKNGLMNGVMVSYYGKDSFGKQIKESESNFVMGVKQGKEINYFENGALMETGNYVNNYRDGRWEAFYPNGAVFSTGNFKMDKYYGVWKVFHTNGQLKQIGLYKDGKSNGEFSFFDEQGRLVKIGLYIDDKKEGIWFIFDQLGHIFMESYKNNKPFGLLFEQDAKQH